MGGDGPGYTRALLDSGAVRSALTQGKALLNTDTAQRALALAMKAKTQLPQSVDAHVDALIGIISGIDPDTVCDALDTRVDSFLSAGISPGG